MGKLSGGAFWHAPRVLLVLEVQGLHDELNSVKIAFFKLKIIEKEFLIRMS